MIQDLSLTLRAILTQSGLPAPLSSAEIVFDRPADPFSPSQTTVDLFLYDIRENVDLRSNEPIIERRNGHVITHRPPLRVACSYLITAWPVGGTELALQEQQLLSQVLQVLSRYPTIPRDFLRGSLVGQEPPLPMVTALVDPQRNLSEFWTALGNRLRPSLTVTVTIAMDVLEPETAPMVITQEVILEQLGLPATQETAFRIGGQVTGAGNAPIAGAMVTLVEPGLTTTTDSDGRYVLGMIPSGTYTLRAQSGATVREVSITIPAPIGSNYNVQLV